MSPGLSETAQSRKSTPKTMKKKIRQRIYILPTNFGGVFMGGAFIMVLIGASYQNNLVNLLAFFMLGLIFVAMVQTHNNLKDIQIGAVEAEDGFADDEMIVVTVLRNNAITSRFNLETALRGRKPQHKYLPDRPLPALGQLRFSSAYKVKKRGLYFVKRIGVDSRYPLGLFRAWRGLDSEPARYFVYPKPEGLIPLPVPREREWESKRLLANKGDDFRGHRDYQKGDPLGHIDWKAYARGRPLLIKELNEGASETLRFDWSQLSHLETEAKLSQLSFWIREALHRRLIFSLHLPGQTVPAGEGIAHAKTCLRYLAVFELSGEEKSFEFS